MINDKLEDLGVIPAEAGIHRYILAVSYSERSEESIFKKGVGFGG